MSNHSQIASTINDAYFTSKVDADFCVSKLIEHNWLNDSSTVLEPAAGAGALCDAISRKVKATVLKQDLLDYGINCKISNYLVSSPQTVDLVFTNPPFGKMATLAVKFFNKATKDAKRLAFIVPQSFRKASIIDRLNLNFWPVADYDLISEEYHLPDGSVRKVKTCFQLWEWREVPRVKLRDGVTNEFFTLSVPSASSFTFRTQGSAAGKVLDGFGHSPNSSRILQGNAQNVRALDLSTIASFTASVPAIGLTELYYAMKLQATNPSKLEKFLKRGVLELLINH